MSENIVLIITLSAILTLSPFLSKITRFPVTVIEVIMGSVAAYLGFLHENGFFEIIAEVGFLYLMFLAGLEINVKDLMRIPKDVLRVGLAYLFLLYMFSILAHFILHLSAMYVLVFSLISIGVVLTLTKEYSKDAKWLKFSLQIGVLGELASIIALTLASGLLNHGLSVEFAMTMLYLILTLVVMGAIFYVFKVAFWWFPELKTLIMPHRDSKDQDVRLSFSLFFLLISFMLLLDLELVLGAFIVGLFINSFFEHKKELPEKLSSFGFGFLIPLFFIHIGSTLNLDLLFVPQILLSTLMITGVMILIRLLSATVFFPIIGGRGVVLFALSQAMPLTLMVAVATLAYHADSIDTNHYYSFILAAILEVVLVLLLIKAVALARKVRTKASVE